MSKVKTALAVKPPFALLTAHPAWRFFPIAIGRKNPPCFADNLELASNDRAQIERWAKQYSGCNWGIALARSNLIVLDVDQKPGKRGRDTLERLELERGQLPETFEVRTPSGGRHLYFTETDIVRHCMKIGAFGPDIDSTNYVVAPGSVLSGAGNDTAGTYRTTVRAMVLPAPTWFAEYLTSSAVGDNAADQAPEVEQDTPDLIARAIDYLKTDAKPSIQFQNGEYALLLTAAMLKDIGISEGKAIELLAEHYNVPGLCEPQWEVGEGATADRLHVKVHNAWAYLNQTPPGSRSPAAAFADDPIDADDMAALDRMVRWCRDREAAIADGTMPSPKEAKAMKGNKS